MTSPYVIKPREKRVRLSVTVPAYLAQWTRAQAKAHGVPVSRVVEVALIDAMVNADFPAKDGAA